MEALVHMFINKYQTYSTWLIVYEYNKSQVLSLEEFLDHSPHVDGRPLLSKANSTPKRKPKGETTAAAAISQHEEPPHCTSLRQRSCQWELLSSSSYNTHSLYLCALHCTACIAVLLLEVLKYKTLSISSSNLFSLSLTHT